MLKRSKIAISILTICFGFLLSTIPSTGRTRIEIPFTNPSGRSGNVQISLPERVFAGDRTEITATMVLLDVENHFDIVRLTGRLEAGFEEMEPGGEVEVLLKPGSPVPLKWKVRTAKNSTYPGNIWLWLEADGFRELVLVREFRVESKFYFGRPVLFFRVLFGSLLLFFGLIFLVNFLRKKQISINS